MGRVRSLQPKRVEVWGRGYANSPDTSRFSSQVVILYMVWTNICYADYFPSLLRIRDGVRDAKYRTLHIILILRLCGCKITLNHKYYFRLMYFQVSNRSVVCFPPFRTATVPRILGGLNSEKSWGIWLLNPRFRYQRIYLSNDEVIMLNIMLN